MSENYSGHAAAGVDLIAQLLPGANAEQVVRALEAERAGEDAARADSHAADAAELARVRMLFTLGTSARDTEHAFNNPLTALMAEAQLLELEDMPAEQRAAVERILDLSRRLVTISRQLGGGGVMPRGAGRRSKGGQSGG